MAGDEFIVDSYRVEGKVRNINTQKSNNKYILKEDQDGYSMQMQLQKISSDDIIQKLNQSKIPLTNLSYTKYNFIRQQHVPSTIQTLQVLPDLSIQDSVNHRQDLKFISFKDIERINDNVMTTIKQRYLPHDQNTLNNPEIVNHLFVGELEKRR